MAQDILQNSAQYVKGIGPQRLKVLNKLGINTISDMLNYFPRRYEDRSNLKPINQLTVGQPQTIRGTVLASGIYKTPKKHTLIFELAVGDSTGKIFGVWFNQPFMKRYFKVGDEIILYGRVEKYKKLVIVNPEFELITDRKQAEDETIHTGRIVPIYPLAEDISQRTIRAMIKHAVDQYANSLKEIIPTPIRARNKLLDIKSAIKNIHFPANQKMKDESYRRLVFEEFFIFQLGLALRKYKIKIQPKGISHKTEGNLIESFKSALPFKLTDAQNVVIKQIEADMAKPSPMNRLLQGDVGSGKTVIAMYVLVLTVQNGHQGVLMVPTEILAQQHYSTLTQLLEPLGIEVALLISQMQPEIRQKTYEMIKTAKAQIIIGTHALIQEKLEFKNLGLIVIDEQHKFGVSQRAVLRKKGLNPDVLVMTATPIPRTLAMTVYGDLDISVLTEFPFDKRPISTWWAEDSIREDVYKFIRSQIKEGRQAYVVCPVIEASERAELKAVTIMYEHLKNEVFKEFKVGLIHGRLKANEKEQIMRQFATGKIDILVSTTVIEVGIDVPNASCMLIEHAERFGLAQLHQLRGRIGRSADFPSYCILISSPKTTEAAARIEAIVSTSDGFKIAEQDLVIRGPGEFLGTKQHGLPQLRIGNILKDTKILEAARKEAFSLVKLDPHLLDPHHQIIKEVIKERFSGLTAYIDVG